MNERDPLTIEVELKRLKPAPPPPALMARLCAIQPPAPRPSTHRTQSLSWIETWWRTLRWLAPATAGVTLVTVLSLWLWPKPAGQTVVAVPETITPSALSLDDVQIDRQLVAAYDALARLPGGEPVRVRCQEWMDEVVLRDSARGLQIEQRTPRFEIMSVSLDTY